MSEQIGVTGLATMGANLARNLARHGHQVVLHNRTKARTDTLIAAHGDEGDFVPTTTVEEFVGALRRPRRILIMVQAGAPTDAVIDELVPLLDEGDIVIDGGNAHYADTIRRTEALAARGLHFMGTGVSGGEEGALNGPSIMPGGSAEAYAIVGPMLESIAAVYDGTPCCTHVGTDGAGHFVKMVHNGIEYADMQLIAESYDLLRRVGGHDVDELVQIFERWNEGDLKSYLIEITGEVLKQPDADTGKPLVDVIRDGARSKGTGVWTVQNAVGLGIPVSGIGEAVFARAVSSKPTQRAAVQQSMKSRPEIAQVPDTFADDVRAALYASKVVAYAQGFDLIIAGAGSDPVSVGDLEPAVQAGLGDPEVLRDLRDRRLALAGDRDHVAAELRRKRCGHGGRPSSEERILTGQESTEPGAVPWSVEPPRQLPTADKSRTMTVEVAVVNRLLSNLLLLPTTTSYPDE
jgi:6-phosphogluconate dehydrogenase